MCIKNKTTTNKTDTLKMEIPVYTPMQDENVLAEYALEQVIRIEEFDELYSHRMEMLEDNLQQPIVEQIEQIEQIVPLQEQPVLSEQSKKEKKAELKHKNKKLKKGKKLTPYATVYTVDLTEQIIKQMKEKVNERESELPMSEEKVQKIKKSVLEKEYSANKYTSDYVATHLEEVLKEQDELKEFLDLFKEDTEKYANMTPYEKFRVSILKEFYTISENALSSALQVHGLEYKEEGMKLLQVGECSEKIEEREIKNNTDVKVLDNITKSFSKYQEEFLEKESEKVLDKVTEERKNIYNELHEEMKKNEETSFINLKLSDITYYEWIRDTKELITSHPQEYKENKKLIDILFIDIQKMMEVLSAYKIKIENIVVAMYDEDKVKDLEVKKVLEQQLNIGSDQYEKLFGRVLILSKSIEHLLQGSELSDKDALVFKEYNKYYDPILTSKEQSQYYAEVYKKKEDIFEQTLEKKEQKDVLNTDIKNMLQVLVKAGNVAHNEDVKNYINEIMFILEQEDKLIQKFEKNEYGDEEWENTIINISFNMTKLRNLEKNLFEYIKEQIMNLDVQNFVDATDEELMYQQDELINIGMLGQMINEIDAANATIMSHGQEIFENLLKGKNRNVLEGMEATKRLKEILLSKKFFAMKDEYLGDLKERFNLYASLGQGYMMKARALSMMDAYKKGVLTEKALTLQEKEEVIAQLGYISEDNILEYAKYQYIVAMDTIEEVSNRYANNEEFQKFFKEHEFIGKETAHKEYDNLQTEVEEYLQKIELESSGKEEQKDRRQLIRSEYTKISKEITDIEDLKKELRELFEAAIEKEYCVTKDRDGNYNRYKTISYREISYKWDAEDLKDRQANKLEKFQKELKNLPKKFGISHVGGQKYSDVDNIRNIVAGDVIKKFNIKYYDFEVSETELEEELKINIEKEIQKLGLEKNMSEDEIIFRKEVIKYVDEELLFRIKGRIELRKKWMEDWNEKIEDLKTKRANLEKNTRLKKGLRLKNALTANNYHLAGEKEPLIKEPIFHSYSSIEQYEEFRNMKEQDFFTMCENLAAGSLEITEKSTKEEIKKYRERNITGLITYKKHMYEHYKALENKYKHNFPTTEYILSHYEEIEKDFANVQVDADLVEHVPKEVLNKEKKEDLDAYHLVLFYNRFGGAILNFIKANIINGNYSDRECREQMKNFIRDERASYEYVNRNF